MSWSRLITSSGGPASRRGHSATYALNKLYVFGGNDGANFFDDLFSLDISNLRWTKLEPSSQIRPGRRRGHTANVIGDKILIFGGCGGEDEMLNDIWILDLASNSWTKPVVRGDPPLGRYAHTATLLGNRLFVFGGCGDAVYNDLFELNIDEMEWTGPVTLQGAVPSRCGHTATLVGSLLICFGGAGNEGFYNDILIIDLETLIVTKAEPISSELPARRRGHTAARVGNFMLVFGGGGTTGANELFNDMYIFDTESLRWFLVNENDGDTPSERTGHTSSLVGSCLYVFAGGRRDGGPSFNDLFSLDLRSVSASIPVSTASPSLDPKAAAVYASYDPETCDTLITSKDGQSIHAHSHILQQRCPHFRTLLHSGMREAQEGSILVPEPFPVLQAFVSFLYSNGTTLDASSEVALDLLRLSEMYFLDRLRWAAMLCIRKNLTITNITSVFNSVLGLAADDLVEACTSFVIDNLASLTSNLDFIALVVSPIFQELASQLCCGCSLSLRYLARRLRSLKRKESAPRPPPTTPHPSPDSDCDPGAARAPPTPALTPTSVEMPPRKRSREKEDTVMRSRASDSDPAVVGLGGERPGSFDPTSPSAPAVVGPLHRGENGKHNGPMGQPEP